MFGAGREGPVRSAGTEDDMRAEAIHRVELAAIALAVGTGVGGCAGASGTGLCGDAVEAPTVDDPGARPIAFTSNRSGSFDLWLMGADGSGPAQLTDSDGAEGMAAWSPDGTRLAFVAAPELEESGDICVVEADGTGMRNLTDTAGVGEIAPAWSPDGDRIAFSTLRGDDTEVHVMDSDGGNSRRLASDGAWPSWAPDGSRLAFSASHGHGVERLWTIGSDGSGEAVLAERATAASQPAFSPDGQWIAFSSSTGDSDSDDPVEWDEDVFVMPADGGSARSVTSLPGNEHWPSSWSPDGAHLAVTSDGEENVGEIVLVDLATLETTNLTGNDAHDAFPALRR